MKDLTQGNEAKVIFKFALPMVVGNVFQQLVQVINTAIVGNFIGADAMAAVGASLYIIFALIALVMGIGIGGTVVISQYFGAKQVENVKKASDTMLIFLTLAGLVIGIFAIIFCRPILRLTNLHEQLYDDAQIYLSINMAGMFAMFGYNAISSVLRGIGDSVRPLYFLVISTTLNLGLDLLFVLVFGWGIKGVAWATFIAYFVSFALVVVYLNKTHELLKFSFKTMAFDKQIFKHILKIGLPSGFQQTFVALGSVALIRIVNSMGVEIMTAYTAAGRIDAFISMPAMNFSAALSAFVGQNLAIRNYKRINRGFMYTLLISGVICLISMLCIYLWGENIMKIFVRSTEPGYNLIIETGHQYLLIVCSFYIVFSTMFVINGLLRGAGATLVPMFVTLLSLWLIRLPIAHMLSKYTDLGAEGIWWAIPMGWTMGLIGALTYFLSGKWKGKSIV